MLCDFGCGREAIYHFKTGAKSNCCSNHVNKCPARKKQVSAVHTGKIPWSKGKTKENDPTIAVISAKLSGVPKSDISIERMKATKLANPRRGWNKGSTSITDTRILAGSKNGMWGKTHTATTKALLSKLAIGFKGENNPWYGKSRSGILSPRYRHDIDHNELQQFKNMVYMLTERTYKMYKDEINPNNLIRAKAGTDGGYQLDHKVSVSWGYENGWSPAQLAAKENLQMLSWRDNLRKHARCDWD